MEKFQKLFPKLPCVIGMIHLRALPGTPKYNAGSWQRVIDSALHEAETYTRAGVDGILVENMNDVPFTNRFAGPEITASMTRICSDVKSIASGIPCGVQILAGCNKEALAVAAASRLDFIRAEAFIFSHVADEGLMHGDAAELLRYRKQIDADNILVFTDVKKKHCSHSITADVGLGETCKAAEFFLSDGVIVTGTATGASASCVDLDEAREACSLPVLIGSGVTADNVGDYKLASGLIVGSTFKEGGYWENKICEGKLNSFMDVVRDLRR